MSCSFLDLACQLAPLIFWAKVTMAVVVAVAISAGLVWVYRTFGWWGVAAAVSAGLAAVIFKKGIDIGRSWDAPKRAPKITDTAPKSPDDILKNIFNGRARNGKQR